MLRSCLAFILFISCLKIYVHSVIVPFTDCGSQSVTVEELNFDCEGGEPRPCKFIKGNTYNGKISFTAKSDVPNGTIVLHAIIGDVTLPFPFDEPNICSNHNLTCPIESGTKSVLTIKLEVPTIAPATNLVAKFEIQPSSKSSTDTTDIMCVEFLADIEASNDLTV